MRVFVCFLLMSAAYAAPQGGYNYQIQVDSAIRNDFTQEQYQLLQQYAQQQLSSQQQVQQPLPQQLPVRQLLEVPEAQHQQVNPEAVAPPAPVIESVQQPPIITPQKQEKPQPFVQQQHYQPPTLQRHEPVQYNKEFFYLSAPQEDFELPQDVERGLESLKKNIRVLFIRAPEQNGLANAALQLAKQSLDQQTVVYVLAKQHDTADLAQKLQQVRNSAHSKPDVIFVKYKTPEEAEHAQRTIQAQYEALEGPNHFNHQGVVSTHDFVGSTAHHHSNRVHVDPRKSSTSAEAEAPSKTYLPAAKKF